MRPRSKWRPLTRMILRRRRSTTQTMTLSFPNQSRFYDATRGAVRFWGQNSAMEAWFFFDAEALQRIKPDMRSDEIVLLGVFDSNRMLIYATAAKVYERGRKGSYDLVASDFRL